MAEHSIGCFNRRGRATEIDCTPVPRRKRLSRRGKDCISDGGVAEVIEHERNGLLFPAGDAKALALTIERVVNDRKLLARLSAAADMPQTVSEYVDQVERIYCNMPAATAEALLGFFA